MLQQRVVRVALPTSAAARCREILRSDIVPNAYLWFTGEAAADEAEEDEDDEDDDDEDEDEDDEARLPGAARKPGRACALVEGWHDACRTTRTATMRMTMMTRLTTTASRTSRPAPMGPRLAGQSRARWGRCPSTDCSHAVGAPASCTSARTLHEQVLRACAACAGTTGHCREATGVQTAMIAIAHGSRCARGSRGPAAGPYTC